MDSFSRTLAAILIAALIMLGPGRAFADDPPMEDRHAADDASVISENLLTDLSCVFDSDEEKAHMSGTVSNSGKANEGPFFVTGVILNVGGSLVQFIVDLSAQRGEWTIENGTASLNIGTMAPNEEIDFAATAEGMPPGEYEIELVLTQDQHNPGDPRASCTIVIEEASPVADLEIDKTGPLATEIMVGDEFGYTIAFANSGPDATTASIQDELPDGVEYVGHEISVDPDPCSFMDREPPNGDRLSCGVDLVPGEEHLLVVTVRATQAGTFKNLATIASEDDDPNEENNTDEVTTEVVAEQSEKSADLSIEKTADNQIQEGIYHLTITNNGPDDTNATIEDQLPAGVEYASHETSGDGQCVARDDANTVVCFYPGLAAGDFRTLTIRTTRRSSGKTTNTAFVSSDVPDPVASNNEASAGFAELHTSKSVASAFAIGSEVTFTILVENTGDGPAREVWVRDLFIGAHLEYISSSLACDEEKDPLLGFDSVVCTIGDIGPGESFSFEVKFRLKAYRDNVDNGARVTAANHKSRQIFVDFVPGDYAADIWFAKVDSPLPVGQKSATDDAFDVYIDSVKVANDAASGTAIRLKPLLTNISPMIHLVPFGSEDLADAVFRDSVNFFTGNIRGDDFHLPDAYTLVFVGPQDDLRLLLQRDARIESEDPAHADFLLVHAAPEAPPVRLRLLDETDEHAATETLAETLAYADMTGYHSLAAAAYNVEVADAASGAQLEVFRLDLSEAGGKVLTLALASDDSGQLALLALDAEGNRQDGAVVTAADDDAALPLEYVLYSNYPNPFNPSTMIRYALPEQTAVRLEIFDALGRVIRTLLEAEQPAGTYSIAWDGRDAAGSPVASGTYLYRITTATFSAARSMMLVK